MKPNHLIAPLLEMPSSKRSQPTSTQPETAETPKVSRQAWKTGEQLEWMLSKFDGFLRHQTDKCLEDFWTPIFHSWHAKWPITPTAESIEEHGSVDNANAAHRAHIEPVSTVTLCA